MKQQNQIVLSTLKALGHRPLDASESSSLESSIAASIQQTQQHYETINSSIMSLDAKISTLTEYILNDQRKTTISSTPSSALTFRMIRRETSQRQGNLAVDDTTRDLFECE